MELDHEFTVPVPAEQAWPALLDVERVAACLPGASLDSVDGDELTGRMKVKVGPVTVTYRGNAAFTHKDERTHAATIEGSGKESRGSGTASVTVTARLHDEGRESTRVTVHSSLQVTGRPAQFGKSMLSEVGSKLIGQFADCLAGQLADAEQDAQQGQAPAAADQAGAAATPEPAAPEPAAAILSQPTTSGGPGSWGQPAPTPGIGPAAAPSPDGHPSSGARVGATSPPGRSGAPPTGSDTLNLWDVASGPVLKRAAPALGAALAIVAVVFAVRRKRRR